MSQQNQPVSYMKIVPSDRTETGQGASSCQATADESQTIDLMAAYRNSRMASQYSISSMRGLSAGFRSGSAGYYRRAG